MQEINDIIMMLSMIKSYAFANYTILHFFFIMATAVDETVRTHLNQAGPRQAPVQTPPRMQQEQSIQAARVEKMKVVELFQAMRRGKMPTNDQIMDLLNNVLESPSIMSRKHLMSSDGQQLLCDFQDLLRVLEKALMEKDKDGLFQSLVYHLRTAPSSFDKGKPIRQFSALMI